MVGIHNSISVCPPVCALLYKIGPTVITATAKHKVLVNPVENQNVHPHPHYRAPCMKHVEGSIRPICMYRPRKYVIPGP